MGVTIQMLGKIIGYHCNSGKEQRYMLMGEKRWLARKPGIYMR